MLNKDYNPLLAHLLEVVCELQEQNMDRQQHNGDEQNHQEDAQVWEVAETTIGESRMQA